MAIRIVTDSAADYTEAELKKRGIDCVPMSVTFGEEEYLDGVNLTKEEFYEKMKEGFPKTSQPSPFAFQKIFEEAKKSGDTVIAILISGGLSGTVQSARLAKEVTDYPDIYIVDSGTATLGMRILVDRAVNLAQRGVPAEEIVRKIDGLKRRISLYAGLDTLEYLAQGGRMPKAAAGIGNLVGLKPIITFSAEGSVALAGKQIGMRRAYRQVAKLVAEDMPDERYPVYFIYCGDRKNCAGFAQYLEKKGMEFGERKFRGIGPTIGSHIGVGAFGIVYVSQKGAAPAE